MPYKSGSNVAKIVDSHLSDIGVVERFYQTLLEVTNILNSQRNTESLWKAITGHIKKVIPWERAGITLYHEDIDGFRFYAVETSMPTVKLTCDTVIPREGSGFGWVYDHKSIHIRKSLQHEQVFLEDHYYLQEGLGRMINLPLIVRDTCLGTLNIGSVESGDPDPQSLTFLRQVATQIAFAIDQVKSYEEISQLREQLARENAYLLEEIKFNHDFGAMIGASQKFKKVLDLAQAVAKTNSSVLITGETGTGKELLARFIHELSSRKNNPFVRINCASLPAGLVESELFGHERGAFTGAEQYRPGKFELADNGTLFLDEIGEMPLEAQAKLLRVLQDGIIDRVGSSKPLSVDVRIIAATNSDLSKLIAEGRFRSDLFYRLHVFPIVIPPLRERPQDIALLARHFMDKNRVEFKRPCQDIDEASLERLLQYSWPGNIRELKNIIERVMILSRSAILHIDKSLLSTKQVGGDQEFSGELKDIERSRIQQALVRSEGKIEGALGAAKQLGLHPSTLRSRLKKLGLNRQAIA
ncbi:sigma-54-dependent Fis family transcriptional regulator [Candidatus Nitronereus thalassa]|uniref:Sigma 54-interacting transcriptional regulator n=1 Tax=Candidatus Nitronereus thalassa TaxID=3020898 RepID=A0ABU3K9Z7_9BACT|nr:sigma 54-interacting transcriptional regulator [Candidatus Nitronereus thalassa]MDT7043215.1 sigma 54-interacting transcriptional regulator [Candidatus Nitronereus thalassa]